jgi:two-component system sensor histidine kinase KdpD
VALVAVAVATVLIAVGETVVHLTNPSMLYLLAVLTVAVLYGSGPAVFAALVAFTAVDWLYEPPMYDLGVTTRGEWLTLLLFLVTAFITGQLAAGQRQRAREAEQREREAIVLYDVVRLMSDPDLDRALRSVADRLRADLDLAGVVVDLVGTADDRSVRSLRAEVGDEAALDVARETSARARQLPNPPAPNGTRGRRVRWTPPTLVPIRRATAPFTVHEVPVSAGERGVGTIFVVRGAGASPFLPADTRLLTTVGVQLGLAVERDRLRREATEAEIHRRGDELKTSLLHAVSHDLRTPLATIMATAGSLRQEEAGWSAEEREELARTIEDEARRLNRIVENLLDLSRIQGGALQSELAWHDLRTVVDDVVARLRVMFPRRTLAIDFPENLPLVSLDRVFVDQILSNLVENAAKYTPRGSEIRISATEWEDEVRIEVADQGAGVAASALDRLFEPFYRTSRPGPRPGGLGIGLAVVRGLVEAQGGRVWARNRPEGGLAVTFTLPRAPEPAQLARNR